MSTTSDAKYQNVILYLCKSLGGTLYGKKKLAKLLYYVDFDRYEYKEASKSITGDVYCKLPMGPVPSDYMRIVEQLVESNHLRAEQQEYQAGYNPFEVYTCLVDPDMSAFDEEDLEILDRVVKTYGGLNGKQLEELTHAEAPFIGTEPNHEIPYELAFYRDTSFDDLSRAR